MLAGRSTRAIAVGDANQLSPSVTLTPLPTVKPLRLNSRLLKSPQLGFPRGFIATPAARTVALMSKRSVMAVITGRPLQVPFVNRADCIDVKIGRLKCLDVLHAIHDTPTDLEIPRPFALPAPLLQRTT